MIRNSITFFLLLLALSVANAEGRQDRPIKVFVLAGQSNMEGKAKLSLLKHQISQPETKVRFQHLHQNGTWLERSDVWIKFLARKGNLTVGYGSPNCFGPELEFGIRVGDHFDEQVLIIKTAWGGKSLFRDFRPPSSGIPNDDVLAKLLKNAQKKKPATTKEEIEQSFGKFYRMMLDEVNNSLANLKSLFPAYENQGHEIAGFVWFQGWNDMVNADYTAEYAKHMANFIRDVRKDLRSPNLPFVIGQLGVDGVDGKANRKRKLFKDAQAQPADLPEFKGNVAVVKTDQFWDTTAHAVFKKGWRDHLKEWNTVGSDYPFHYLGSAKTFSDIGKAFGDAVLSLQEKPETTFYDPIEKDVEGWTIAVDPQLLQAENSETAQRAFAALANHLQRIKFITPDDQLKKLQQMRIWIELNNPVLGNMQYHPGRGWLIANGHDPRLVKHVHIPRAKNLYARHMWAKHPYVVLHELAHAFHDQLLGFDNVEISALYAAAKEKGIYDKVLLYTGKETKHYGMNNPMEYFAEATEAYFGVNDFYPFVRAELQQHDPEMFKLLEKIWGRLR